jgi:hypothetical protein
MAAIATEYLSQNRLKGNELLNKNKVTKEFKKFDYVFVLDRLQIPGSGRPLKTKFYPSPYVVLSAKFTSSLVMRLSDGFQTVYSNNDLKIFSHTSPLFRTLPVEVSKILLYDFQNLLDHDLCTLAKFDTLHLPSSIPLFEEEDDPSLTEGMVDTGQIGFHESEFLEATENPLQQVKNAPASRLDQIDISLSDKLDVPNVPDDTNRPDRPPKQLNHSRNLLSSEIETMREEPEFDSLQLLDEFHNDLSKEKNNSDEEEEIINDKPNHKLRDRNKRKVRFNYLP